MTKITLAVMHLKSKVSKGKIIKKTFENEKRSPVHSRDFCYSLLKIEPKFKLSILIPDGHRNSIFAVKNIK